MLITFYKIDEPNNKLVKTLIGGFQVDATLYEPYSLEQPQVILSTAYDDYNYAYIEDYDRYYFVGEPIMDHDGLIIYPFMIDVLMSNKDQILDLEATIQRQEYNFNEYINDGTFIPDTREFIQCINFTNGFNDSGELILITAGGVATI